MIIAVWLFFALLVGIYASRRGRSGVGWFLLATVISPLLAFLLCLALGPIAKPGTAADPSQDIRVKCPDCRELVLPDARVCKHCGAALTPQEIAAPAAPQPAANFAQVWQRNKALILVIGFIAMLAVVSTTR